MKKTILSFGIAAVAVSALFAQNDKLTFFRNSQKVQTVRVDDIREISYLAAEEPGFKSMRIDLGTSEPVIIDIDGFDRIDYLKGLPDNPVQVVVDPHYACATMHITSSDPDALYRFCGVPVYDLGDMPEAQWADYLFARDEAFCQSVAAAYDLQLSDFSDDYIFYRGDNLLDWWPTTNLLPDEDAVILVYTGKIAGNNIEMTTEPRLLKFHTKKAEVLNTEYDIDVEFSSNTYTIKAKAREIEGTDRNIPFYIDLYRKDQLESNTLDVLTVNTLSQLEQSIYNSGRTWLDAMYYTEGERTVTNTRVGEEMVAVVYGCEYGVINTPFFVHEFTVPAPEITNEATFEVTLERISNSEYTLGVIPSDDNIEWTAMLVESSRIPDEYSRIKAISSTLYYENVTNPYWHRDYAHKGQADGINTQSGILSGNYMTVGTEYSILVFGIDENGGVITAVNETRITPQTSAASLELDITFSGYTDNGNSAYLTARLVPGDKNAKFVFDYLPEDNAMVNLNCTDEEFIQRYVTSSGEYLDMHVYTGDTDKIMSMSKKFNSALGTWVYGNYIAFAFGYDGTATSGLYVYKVNAGTGEVEVLRAPQPVQPLTLDVTIDNFRAVNSTLNYIDVKVVPSDPDAKYIIESLPAANSLFNGNPSDEELIANYVAAQGQYLGNSTYTGEHVKIFSLGQQWNSALGMFTFSKYNIFVFGYDGEQTSVLQMFEVDGGTGTVTQVRGATAD